MINMEQLEELEKDNPFMPVSEVLKNHLMLGLHAGIRKCVKSLLLGDQND